MTRTRTTLAVAAAGALLLSLGASASAAPGKCSKTVGGAVHAADQTAARLPVVGSTAGSLVHEVVEPVACSLPV